MAVYKMELENMIWNLETLVRKQLLIVKVLPVEGLGRWINELQRAN